MLVTVHKNYEKPLHNIDNFCTLARHA